MGRELVADVVCSRSSCMGRVVLLDHLSWVLASICLKPALASDALSVS